MGRDEFVVEMAGEVLVYPVVEGSPEHDRLIGWLETNAINHEEVPVPSRAVIADGMLTVELFVLDADGRHYVDPEDDSRAARTTLTVPLVVDPPDCWLRREVSHGAA